MSTFSGPRRSMSSWFKRVGGWGSELWCRGKHWRLPGIGGDGVQLAPIDPVIARRIEGVEGLAPEGDAPDAPARHGQDGVDAAGLVADLDAEVGGDIEPSGLVTAE